LNVSYLAETKESGVIHSAITNGLDDREIVFIFSAVTKSFRFFTVPNRIWDPPSVLTKEQISDFSFAGHKTSRDVKLTADLLVISTLKIYGSLHLVFLRCNPVMTDWI